MDERTNDAIDSLKHTYTTHTIRRMQWTMQMNHMKHFFGENFYRNHNSQPLNNFNDFSPFGSFPAGN